MCIKCLYCDQELEYNDYYGYLIGWNDFLNEPIISKEGEIYRCPNESCLSDEFNSWFHTRPDHTELYEGYPC
jgi:hypothetical protein